MLKQDFKKNILSHKNWDLLPLHSPYHIFLFSCIRLLILPMPSHRIISAIKLFLWAHKKNCFFFLFDSAGVSRNTSRSSQRRQQRRKNAEQSRLAKVAGMGRLGDWQTEFIRKLPNLTAKNRYLVNGGVIETLFSLFPSTRTQLIFWSGKLLLPSPSLIVNASM